jgi:hypothetical protein
MQFKGDKQPITKKKFEKQKPLSQPLLFAAWEVSINIRLHSVFNTVCFGS